MNFLTKAIDFSRHWWQGKSRHGVHSPFVYALVDECIYAQTPEVPSHISAYFQELKANQQVLEGYDFGARQETKNTVGKYAANSAIADYQAALLLRLVHYFQPKTVLELGSNLGKSLAVMASACRGASFTGVEGNAALAAVARENLHQLGLDATVVYASFDQFLADQNGVEARFDFVFLDGDHHYEPTMRYFNALKKLVSEGGVIVMHDIHWSAGMKKAWRELQNMPDVTVTIDLYWLGLVFLHRNQAKENFAIRFPLRLVDLF